MRQQLKLKNIGKKIAFTDIDAVQTELGIKFPDVFIVFLLQNNGGDYSSEVPKTKDGYEFGFRNFIGINDTLSSISNMFLAVSEAFENSKAWLPFGFDGGDWIYCICLKEDQYGQIYLMRTDETIEDEAFIFVCNSFEEFIDDLQPESTQA